MRDGLAKAVPLLRSSWTAGKAGEDANAAAARVSAFIATLAPSLSRVAGFVEDHADAIRAVRSRIDLLNSAYAALSPLQAQVMGFGDWIAPEHHKAYDAALTAYRIVAQQTGFNTVEDIDAAYARATADATSLTQECRGRISAETARFALPGGRPGSSAFAVGLPGSSSAGPLLDDLIARGVLPTELRGKTTEEILAYLKDHPDVARRLAQNSPRPGSAGPEGFLYSLNQPGIVYPEAPDTAAIYRARIREYFERLSPEDQKLLGLLFPTQVGNLSGAPFVSRSTGNHVSIIVAADDSETRIAELQRRKALWDRSSPGSPFPDRQTLWMEQAQVQAYRSAIDHPEKQIVVFDALRGAYAEVSGSIGPQTSNVAVLCPGTGTNMSSIQHNVAAYAGFVRAAPSGSLVVITWMGGALPQDLVRDAPLASYSQDLGPRLAEFSKDVRQEIASTDASAHLTIAGHSYGGAVVGIAETAGLDADRVLHIESAGMGNGVQSVGEYHPVNPQVQRFSMTAPGDSIEWFRGGQTPSVGHGANPDSMDGVIRLATGNYADGTRVDGFPSHSGVFAEGSESWQNMYQVFTGGVVEVYTPPVYDASTPWGVLIGQDQPPTTKDIP